MFNKYLLELLQLKILWYNLFWNATMQWCIVWFNQILNLYGYTKRETLNSKFISWARAQHFFVLTWSFPNTCSWCGKPKALWNGRTETVWDWQILPQISTVVLHFVSELLPKQHKTDQSEPVLATCWEHFI